MAQRNSAAVKTAPKAGGDGRPRAVAPRSAGATGLAGQPLSRKESINIAALCVAAFLLRLLFIRMVGHRIDISTFESWLLTLSDWGPVGFYSHVQFIDYPPGYMLILWFAAGFHALIAPLAKFGIDTLIISIKMPAILADVGLVYLTYLIMRRNWSTQTAFIGAAIITLLNPGILFLSAYWGQADSVAVVFLFWGLYLALTDRFDWAWVALAFAILIKPHPIAIAPLLLLWQIRRQGFTWRLIAIPILSLAVAYIGSAWFATVPSLFTALPSFNQWVSHLPPWLSTTVTYAADLFKSPIAVLRWLYDTYQHGRDGYPYNSVNAFNLYSVKNDFWQSDLLPVTLFGVKLGPLWAWGLAIFTGFVVAIGLRQWRTTGPDESRENSENSFLFACFLVMLGYFILLTRMHERYLFTAIVLIVLVRPLGAVQRIATLALASTFIVNLIYGLYYVNAPSVDLNPLLVHSLSALNVLVFFAVAAVYLIEEFDVAIAGWFMQPFTKRVPRLSPQLLEGLIGFTRLDWWLAAGLTAAGALLLFYRISEPNSRIFDEIYYARAAQEYLHHQYIYESTHPPLAKLCMAASAWFFQVALPAFGAWLTHNGISAGSFFVRNQIGDPVSSRIASALAGVATVPLLYAFAKRLFASTSAAVVAVVLLLTSGFFFVQARTALPDIFVGLFSLASLYCAYRFVTAGQIVRRAGGSYPDGASNWATVGVAAAIVLFVALEVAFYDPAKHPALISWYIFLGFMPLLAAFCAFWAWRLRRERETGDTRVYPDGSVVEGSTVTFPSLEQRPLKSASYDDGVQKASWSQAGVALSEGDAKVTWQADGAIAATAGGLNFVDRQHWGLWAVLTGVALGAVCACKWYGLFDITTILLAAALITLQGFLPAYWRWREGGGKLELPLGLPRRFVWGNPLGWRLPLFLGCIVLFGLTVYVLTWIPFFTLGNTFQDMLAAQHGMYQYHHDLRATHPYASQWWTWPLDIRPVAYYYQTLTKPGEPLQIVAEVTALPNPIVWLAGLITIPLAGWLAWRERHKGMLIVVAATFLHWLPWAGSPRIDFQYNIYNNTALLCLCTAYVLLLLWRWAHAHAQTEPRTYQFVRYGIAAYLALCIGVFGYFYPVLAAAPITYQNWLNHMWLDTGCKPDQKVDCIGWV